MTGIVDAHHHLWRLSPGSHPWLDAEPALARDATPETYAATFAGHEIEATVWVEALAADPEAELRAAEAMRRESGGRIATALVAHAPLDAPDLPGRLDRLAAISPALRGIRDIVAPAPPARAPDLLDRPGFAAGLAELSRRGLVFDLMLRPAQIARAARLLDQLPDLRVGIEHLAAPHDPAAYPLWRDGLARLAAHPGTVLKVSALQVLVPGGADALLRPLLETAAEHFGPHRMCFGTDHPAHDRHCPGPDAIAALDRLTAGWTDGARRALFRDTARALYRLD